MNTEEMDEKIVAAAVKLDPYTTRNLEVERAIFKAGMENGDMKSYEIGVADGKVEGIAEGIQEVVEWIKQHGRQKASYAGNDRHVARRWIELSTKAWLREWGRK